VTSRLEPLVLVGAGGLGRETAELVADINRTEPTWDLLGFVDDDPLLAGTRVIGLPVLGPIAQVASLGAAVVVCTARPAVGCSRPALVERLDLPESRRPSLVHPSASLASSTRLGPGCIVLAGVVATAQVTLGAHVVVMPQVVLTHDDVVDDYATLASGVRLGGGVHVAAEAYLGAGALVREGCRVGTRALVGMGAVVLEDVASGQVWAGVPARPIKPVLSAVAGVNVDVGGQS
jgi:sugar O-acyltransferase (sialic acid O-acetyltransferase NeuD family)